MQIAGATVEDLAGTHGFSFSSPGRPSIGAGLSVRAYRASQQARGTERGEGKANQYFLRGYNLDHGTDLATFVDDMPINMRNRAFDVRYAT
jgi:hypothetical protein